LVNHGSEKHQRLIVETIEQLENLGYTAINLKGVAPDGIAIKDNKIYAIEVLLINHIPKKGWKHLKSVRNKRERYKMFDDIIFKISDRDIKILTGQDKEQKRMEKKAKRIVDNWITDTYGEV
jgi:hypothetical protein